MMMSPALSPKTLALVLIIFSVSSVALAENLQEADGLSMSATRLLYQVDVGETQMLTWSVQNDREESSLLEFRVEGKGSEFLIFEKFIEAGPKEIIVNEIYLSIPEDHPDNVEYRVKLFALQKGELPAGGQASGAIVNVQVLTEPIIKIGDNPIFNQEPLQVIEKPEVKESVEVEEEAETIVDAEPEVDEESVADKLAAIRAANEAKEVIVDDVWQEEFEEEAVPDYEPEPIATTSATPGIKGQQETKQCGFLEWFFSLFGIESDCI